KKAAGSLKPNQYMDAKMIAFTKDYLAKFDTFSAGFQQYLDAVPKSQLLPVASLQSPTGTAFAQDKDRPNEYGTAYLAVTAPIKDTTEAKQGWLATGWNGIKTAVHGTQSVIGVGVDIAGTAVQNITRVGAGLYYGNTAKEVWTDMKANSKQIITNWKNNKSGAGTMRTANEYINNIDNAADYVGSKAAEQVFGDGWTSWGVGKVSKAAASMLTGLGKGITLVGNRDAQASDYVIGTAEIVSSAIGGSKLVLKGTQLPAFLKGLTKGSWITANGAVNAVSKAAISLKKAEIDALIKTAIQGGIQAAKLEGRSAIQQAMLAAISQSNQALKAEFANIIKAGMKAGWANFNGTLKDSLYDFTKKQFTTNLKSIASLFGSNGKDFADNVMAQWVEDIVKDLVDKAMAEAPLAEELKGLWSGTTVFTSIQVPQAASDKAKKEGCDIAGEFKKMEGKPMPTTLSFDGSPSGSGNATLKISKGSPTTARYTYSAGAMTISQAIKGGTISMRGQATRMTQGYAMSGPVTMAGGSNGVFISMSGSFNVTKSH
ncbi:MAG: hypothetical protein WCL39_10210, partial [Armatimonadota bacterium]